MIKKLLTILTLSVMGILYGFGFSSSTFAFSSSSSAVHASSNDEEKKLVRLAVMSFVNQTGSKNYEYLSGSLSEDIKKNIKKMFSYQKTSQKENERALKEILKSKGKKKKHLNLADIRDLSKKQNIDAVIYGDFNAYQKRRSSVSRIIIQPKLYLRFFDKLITLKSVRNRLDSSIFNVTKKASSIILNKINELVELHVTLKSTVMVTQVCGGKSDLCAGGSEARQKGERLLKQEISRLKVYLNASFEGDISELFEYLKQNPAVKPPKKLKKNTLLNWRIDNKIGNLVRFKLKGADVAVFINQKGGKQTKVIYSLASSGKSDAEIKKELDKAYTKISSTLKKGAQSKAALYMEDFTLGWDLAYLEVGLAAGSGLAFFPNASPLLMRMSPFIRFSPGILAENHNIDFLSDFTHPFLKSIIFDLSFGIGQTLPDNTDDIRDDAGGVWLNQFALQIYSASLGVGYAYIFKMRMRVLAGVAFAYYLSLSDTNFVETTVQLNKSESRLIYAPALSMNTAFQYLWLSHLSLGLRLEYMHYFGNSLSGGGSNISQIGLLLETAYVF